MKEPSQTLHLREVHKLTAAATRAHTIIVSIAISTILYFRASFLLQRTTNDNNNNNIPLLPWLLIFSAELLLSFLWLLGQSLRWRPVYRTPFPERLPEDEKLPSIDVFICTADPSREPTLDVMNTVISALGLDYPADKLHVYLSDDGGASVTLEGMKAAWTFAKSWWLPFCRRYGIKTRSPQAYFLEVDEDLGDGDDHFLIDTRKVKEKYKVFKERVLAATRKYEAEEDRNKNSARDHPALVQVINDDHVDEEAAAANGDEEVDYGQMPLLVYVAREKRPSHDHNFKAGSLNVLLRVSALISNSGFILVLDCDMYCNDPSSARQAMCFHLDPNITSSLAFVQYPQRFYNVSRSDIYDSALKVPFLLLRHGMDGIEGPCLSGTGFYIKRKALYGSSVEEESDDLVQLRRSFGSSNKFIKSLHKDHKPNVTQFSEEQFSETQFVAFCEYEHLTKWGQEVGFLYYSIVEDYFTGFHLHCKGWISVFCDPKRPQFLGVAATNLNDVLIQGTRWSAGLVEVGLSKYCPLIYGLSRISVLERMSYAWVSFYPLCFSGSLWCLSTIPQLCLFYNIPLYPKVGVYSCQRYINPLCLLVFLSSNINIISIILGIWTT
ncbi:hypothetical protein Dimus_028724 [Dionaea muscipula]